MTITNASQRDQQARLAALDPTQSFIIQAPAGSGKTELLTQRFLLLLARAHHAPEEIVAITFTRKAAAEMRNRILDALILAQQTEIPSESHRQITYRLAQQVLARDAALGWQLQTNPNRLRILTIDALAAKISAQIPILAHLGAEPTISDDPELLYQEATARLFAGLSHDAPWSTALKQLLLHLDNRTAQLQMLLAHMLAKREQWLRHIIQGSDNLIALQNELERGLKHIVIEQITATQQALDQVSFAELLPLAEYAAQQLLVEQPEHPICACVDLSDLLTQSVATLPKWRGLAHLLLTQKYEWRQSVTKRIGFPTSNRTMKERMTALLAQFETNDTLKACLHALLECPPPHYSAQQWQIIQALSQLLPLLTAQLHVIFQERNVIDFTELSLGALRALGSPEEPTDLALHLDYQIHHLLVDEFQDTSVTQFQLFTSLVAGWQADDGRTVFLVGDPMQSIYRFRNAEVGLFLRAQQNGLAAIPLTALNLELNFRSADTIVNWVNTQFRAIFPTQANISSGAIPLTPAHAVKQDQYSSVQWHAMPYQNRAHEGQKIAAIIQTIQQQAPHESIAILVRSRNQLATILPTLKQQQISFKAVDIDPLQTCQEIQDLMILIRALLHRADRIAWLALLRAPWCGLTLHDLHAIAATTKQRPLWDTLRTYQQLPALSDDASARLKRIIPILHESMQQQGRLSFSQWIEGTWITLGGPACLQSTSQLANVNSFFKLLDELEQQAQVITLQSITNALTQLFAEPDATSNDLLQIMTIHKSKGLEFDHVILPDLARSAPHESHQLLLWHERPSSAGSNDLILAPIKAQEEDYDPIYHYLKSVEQQKLHLESARLLYVAATRAKKALHLITSVRTTEDPQNPYQQPPNNSFLHCLWLLNQATVIQALEQDQIDNDARPITASPLLLNRLKTSWSLPLLDNHLNPQPSFIDAPDAQQQLQSRSIIDLRLANNDARIIGTVIHEVLQQIAEQGITAWQNRSLSAETPYWQRRLLQLGMNLNQMATALADIKQAITTTLADARGRWIFDAAHQDAHNEYVLTAVLENQIHHVIIDRCFLDRDGIRWIIDYKTSQPQPQQSLAEFLDQEQQLYQEQLARYAAIMALNEPQPIQLGLYFPLIPAWRTWS